MTPEPRSERNRVTRVSVILNPPTRHEEKRTYVIFGTRRGGTSMVAGVARALGLDIGNVGEKRNNEDAEFQGREMASLRSAVRRRNGTASVWGWKYPAAAHYLPAIMNDIRNPYFIVVYRDPVASALSQLKRDGEAIRRMDRVALHESASNSGVATSLAFATDRPTLMLSYELSVNHPGLMVDELAEFLGLGIPDTQRREAIINYARPGAYKRFGKFFDEAPASGDSGASQS